MKFLPYQPEQGYLLPPNVREVLGENHLCFFLHRVVERLDLRAMEAVYGEQGQRPYPPVMMVKVWLYAYALGITSSRRLEQRVKEDLPLRYLAGCNAPDYWTLNDFRRRQRRALNDVFTQVVELAREMGLGSLGHVAVDTTRVAANAARHRVDTENKLREERAQIRRRIRHWQQACDRTDPDEAPGMEVSAQAVAALQERLEEIPSRLKQLKKSGQRQLSRTDPESRFLKQGRTFVLGYTVATATTEDHLIVEQRVGRQSSDNELLLPVIEAVKERCREWPEKVSGDSGFYSDANLEKLEARGIDGYVPDPYQARDINLGVRTPPRHWQHPAHQRMVNKLGTPAGRAVYARRKGMAEPVFGVLKQQRGLRQFRLRGLAKVAAEVALATTAFNLTRMWRREQQASSIKR
ncbi:MAG TPA: IS1182 family transposase [Phycisphaerae bacterium]|nr:IS1182 family transposase [Phycisphaerae bacterium]